MEMYPVLIYYESIKVIFRFEDNLENRNRIHYGSKSIMNYYLKRVLTII